MTEETSNVDPAHETARRLVAETVTALAVALAAAALTVVVVAWIGTWEDVQQVSLAHYLFWPLAVAAVTLQVAAGRLGRASST